MIYFIPVVSIIIHCDRLNTGTLDTVNTVDFFTAKSRVRFDFSWNMLFAAHLSQLLEHIVVEVRRITGRSLTQPTVHHCSHQIVQISTDSPTMKNMLEKCDVSFP